MQKSLSCEKSYPTHISTVTELRQCADSTFQSFPEHPTLGLLLFTIPAGLGTVLENKPVHASASSGVCGSYSSFLCSAGWQRASPHLWEAGRNPLLQIGKLRHGTFLSDFVPNHAVSELLSWEQVPAALAMRSHCCFFCFHLSQTCLSETYRRCVQDTNMPPKIYIYIYRCIYIYISNEVLPKLLYLFLSLTKILTQIHSKSPAPTVQCRQLNN